MQTVYTVTTVFDNLCPKNHLNIEGDLRSNILQASQQLCGVNLPNDPEAAVSFSDL